MELARLLRPEARLVARGDRKEQQQAEYRALARAQNLQLQLDLLATRGAVAIDRFEECQSGQGVSARDGGRGVEAGLAGILAVTNQQAFLRKQAAASYPTRCI